MKIITLNIFGGRIYQPLIDFLQSHQDVDVFCFQEILHNAEGKTQDELLKKPEPIKTLFTDIGRYLPNHTSFFRPHVGDFYGLAMFVHKRLGILDEGEEFVYLYKGFPAGPELDHHARNIQYARIKDQNKIVTIANFHGLWNREGKDDTNDRIEQSDKVIDFLKTIENDYVLCGDFNLNPNTESLKKFTDFGLRNLIVEYGITSTRTRFYEKENKFADYVFVSPEVTVKDFQVLPDEVSDHAALLVEIEI